MRNLKNIRLQETPLESDFPLTATAWDASNDALICAFGPTESSAVIELRRKHHESDSHEPSFSLITAWDAPCPLPDLPCDKILSLQYFADISAACLILAGGDIIVVREKPYGGEEKIEIVGSVDAGIAAATWAPDEELLALVTRAQTLLYMTRDFDNVSSITFSADDLKASNHVSVGWGKKETQFKGKGARVLRDPTMPETVDEGSLSTHDDGKTTISWRGDGAFVAINNTFSGQRRLIRIYSREGVLDSVSEPVNGLEDALSWRPAGNLIAGIQRLNDRVDVVFFERNGLRHGQFPLRLSKTEMDSWASKIDLSWNADSTVLAVAFQDRVHLWTMGNYHYYLKQDILFGGQEDVISFRSYRWHPEKPLRLALGTTNATLDLEFVFNVTRGPIAKPDDFGIVAVIDGRTLKLTPLKLSATPPPMATRELAISENVIDVSTSQVGSRLAVLTSRSVHVYEWDLATKPIKAPSLLRSVRLDVSPEPTRQRQVLFVKEDEVYVLQQRKQSGQMIEVISVEDGSQTSFPLTQDNCQGLFISNDHQILWYLATNPLRKLTLGSRLPDTDQANGIMHDRELAHIKDSAWIEVIARTGASGMDEHIEYIVFTLTKKGELFADGRQIARACTSFLVTPAHLMFTTPQHLLKFVHITDVRSLEVPGDTPEADERCRSIERGARLITVSPSIYAVTLQMPRGNLETIYPRALVLAGIRQHIDDKDYRAAYLTCRNHMVDMNILHDYAPEQFMTNVDLVVDQFKKPERIDELLSKLKDEDVSVTLYKNTITSRKVLNLDIAGATPLSSSDGKVNRICDAFLTALHTKPAVNMKNMITAHVCKRPADLEAGLLLVADLGQESAGRAEEAAEHICFLTDANRLYDSALGLYNLQLALLVAQQSQKDPREYLPFLQKLQNLHETRRSFEIDDHLRRYAKAMKSLHSLEAHQELRAYTTKHTLYSAALELYQYQPEHLQPIMRIFADYLQANSRYRDAAIAYESLALYDLAWPAYQLAHQWREALTCAMLAQLPGDQFHSLAQSLATSLVEESKDYQSAATIQADHLFDIITAAKLLCKGSFFGEATRLLALHGQTSAIPSVLDAGLAEKFSEVIELLADCRGQFNAQVPRIRELRTKKAEDPLAFFGDGGGGADGADVPDNVSLAATDASTTGGQSLFTRYTNRDGTSIATGATRKTSKTRRREERKRARGKKGSVYEEEYLVNSVRRLIDRINSVVVEVRRLVEGLMRRGMRERAQAAETAVLEMVKQCQDCIPEVFEIEDKQGEIEAEEFGEDGGRPSGADGVYFDSVEQRARPKEPPVVQEFNKLSLLGT